MSPKQILELNELGKRDVLGWVLWTPLIFLCSVLLWIWSHVIPSSLSQDEGVGFCWDKGRGGGRGSGRKEEVRPKGMVSRPSTSLG